MQVYLTTMEFNDTNEKINKQKLNNGEFDSFFMHSLFDAYVKKGDGGNSEIVANKFLSYLNEYIEVNKISKKKDIYCQLQESRNFFENVIKESYNIGCDISSKENASNILIFSGFNINKKGHAVNLYFEKKISKIVNNYYHDKITYYKWDLYVINSGLGLQYQDIEKKKLKETDLSNKVPIIIKKTNVGNKIFKKICELTNLLNPNPENISAVYTTNNYVQKMTREYYPDENRFIQLFYDELFNITDKAKDTDIDEYEYEYEYNEENSDDNEYDEDNKWQIYKEDSEQLSSSCSYYANYYFIKYFVFRDIPGEFVKYIEFIKGKLIEKFIKSYTINYKLNINDYNFDFKQNILNAYEIILKNYEFNEKQKYIEKYHEYYSSIFNTINPILFYKYESTKIDISLIFDYFKEYKVKITDKIIDFDVFYNFLLKISDHLLLQSYSIKIPNIFEYMIIKSLLIISINDISIHIDNIKKIIDYDKFNDYCIKINKMKKILFNFLQLYESSFIYINLLIVLINSFIKLIDNNFKQEIFIKNVNNSRIHEELTAQNVLAMFYESYSLIKKIIFLNTNYGNFVKNIFDNIYLIKSVGYDNIFYPFIGTRDFLYTVNYNKQPISTLRYYFKNIILLNDIIFDLNKGIVEQNKILNIDQYLLTSNKKNDDNNNIYTFLLMNNDKHFFHPEEINKYLSKIHSSDLIISNQDYNILDKISDNISFEYNSKFNNLYSSDAELMTKKLLIDEKYLNIKTNLNMVGDYIKFLIINLDINKWLENLNLLTNEINEFIILGILIFKPDVYTRLKDNKILKNYLMDNKKNVFYEIIVNNNILEILADLANQITNNDNKINIYENNLSKKYLIYISLIYYDSILFDSNLITKIMNYIQTENYFQKNNNVLIDKIGNKDIYLNKIEEEENYYYYDGEKYVSIIKKENYYKIVNGHEYMLYNFTDKYEILDCIINKLNSSNENFTVFVNKNIYLLEINNYENIFIRIDKTENTIKIKIKNIDYDILFNFSPLYGIWIRLANNGFILKYNDEYFILLLMNKNYINNNFYKLSSSINKIWYNDKFNNIIWDEDNYYNLIKLNYTGLGIITSEPNDYISLFITMLISKNNFGIGQIIKFLINYNKNFSNKYIDFIFKCNYIDIPYWALIKSKLDYKKRLKYIGQDLFDINYYYSVNLKNINCLKPFIAIKEIVKSLGKYKKNFIDKITGDDLCVFLKNFKSICDQINTDKNEEIINQKIIEFKVDDEKFKSNDIFIFNYLVNTKRIANISNLYLIKSDFFYTKLIYKKYFQIYQNILNTTDYSCDNLLKILEPLDIDIVLDFEKNRTIEEIIFEIHNELLVRKEQHYIITKINNDIISETNDKVYEILMGKGKTSTITPILLNKIYLDKTIESININSINIVLPEHLVPSSFDVIFKYSQIFFNVDILQYKNINSTNNKLFDIFNDHINIFSDSSLKNIILKNNSTPNKDSSQLKDSCELKDNKSVFIFDEIDTIIDPLKSDLNIPNLIKSNHSIKDVIYTCADILINNNFNIKSLNFLYQFIDDNKEITAIIKKFDSIKKNISNLEYNKNFGFGYWDVTFKTNLTIESNIINNSNFYTAIPYSANNNPINGSQFSDFELNTTLTIISYLNIKKFRKEDVALIICYLKQIYKNSNDLELILNVFSPLTNLLNYEDLPQIFNQTSSNTFLFECEKISKKIIWNKSNLRIYLEKIIFNIFFKISKTQNNISMIDIFDKQICWKKISFSGTTNFYLPQKIINDITINCKYDKSLTSEHFNEIIIDKYTQGSIKSSIFGITTSIPNIYYYKIENSEKNFICWVLDNIDKYQSIIDCGGLIVSYNQLDIVKIISRKISDKYILFLNDEDIKFVYHSGEIFRYENQVYPTDKIFIYYDNKHCVGIDFKQPNKMKAIITLNSSNTLTQLSQSIYRLRNINIGHTIDFYCPDINNSFKNVNDIYDNVLTNEINYKKSTLGNLKLQLIKYINRVCGNFNYSRYKEYIYYDLEKNNDKLIDYNTFINIFICDIKNINKGKLWFNSINFTGNQINLQIQRELKQEQEHELEKEKEKVINILKLSDETQKFEIIKSKKMSDYFNNNPLSKKVIKFSNWNIIIEGLIINFLVNQEFVIYYFFYNTKNPLNISIITSYEFYQIIFVIQNSKSMMENILLLNSDGNFIYGNIKHYKFLSNSVINLFFEKDIGYIKKINSLIEISLNEKFEEYIDNLQLFEKFFNKNLNYNFEKMHDLKQNIIDPELFAEIFNLGFFDENVYYYFYDILNKKGDIINIREQNKKSIPEKSITKDFDRKHIPKKKNRKLIKKKTYMEDLNEIYKKKYLKYKMKYLQLKNNI